MMLRINNLQATLWRADDESLDKNRGKVMNKKTAVMSDKKVSTKIAKKSGLNYLKKADQKILAGLDLAVKAGEVHVILGPNGAGKSSLARILAGDIEHLKVTADKLTFKGHNLSKLDAGRRARAGLFLAFQHPVEFSGVNNAFFLKAALNAKRQSEGLKPLDALDFLQKARGYLKILGLKEDFLERGLNEGFSGGEKKINEVLQMMMLKPDLAILDEIDSGLDVDAIKRVARGIKSLIDGKRSFIVITHQLSLIKYLSVTRVHLLKAGRIVRSGPADLARRLSKEGFADGARTRPRRSPGRDRAGIARGRKNKQKIDDN